MKKKNARMIERMNSLKNELYKLKANYWLEEIWVTDLYSVPDPFIVVRTNEESYPVFTGSKRYYDALPDYCDSLKKAIMEEFNLTDEEYLHRIGEKSDE